MMGLFGFSAGLVGMLLMALLWIALVAALVWGVGRLFPRERRSSRDLARDVVARRYAAGEISEAEYYQALRALEAG